MSRRIYRYRWAALWGVAILVGCADREAPGPVASGPAPAPGMSPAEVVRVVMGAMQHNDEPGPDAGIATAFRFASPANRSQTGPLEKFIPMVKNPAYVALLNSKEVEMGAGDVDPRGEHARQLVTVTTPAGEKVTYLFGLTRQGYGEYTGCWMTDAVLPVAGDAVLPAWPSTQPAVPGEGQEEPGAVPERPGKKEPPAVPV